ncbi:MAG: HAD family hydrolase [Chloroflexota bacterium]|nr:MAG: HAD family hydrolase [Chloroflexota bacterium]
MRLPGVRAVTLDFGNTLVPVDRAALRAVVASTAADVSRALEIADPATFLTTWAEERDRQFREEVPRFREVDLPQRSVRVLARLRGAPVPPAMVSWDDAEAARWSTPDEVALVVDAYSAAFVAVIPAPSASGELIHDLAGRGFRVAILSNWPLAATIDRFADAAGWAPALAGIFVSQRIGTIKPHPAIFRHAEARLGVEPSAILHVGDDWLADVGGAKAAGWLAAYLLGHQLDTPLPTSTRSDDVSADLELTSLADLGRHLRDPR